jgi:hypothetical protein
MSFKFSVKLFFINKKPAPIGTSLTTRGTTQFKARIHAQNLKDFRFASGNGDKPALPNQPNHEPHMALFQKATPG